MTNTLLLIGLFFCHFLADFTHLAPLWMQKAKRIGYPYLPIFAHAAVHATLMGAFLVYAGAENSIELAIYQLLAHFAIDVWKGKMNVWFPSLQSQTNIWHWVTFGFDQFLHAIVIVLMVNSTVL
jgi:hypothetical protein